MMRRALFIFCCLSVIGAPVFAAPQPPECGGIVLPPPVSAARVRPLALSDGNSLDLLIAYTPDALREVGSKSQIEKKIHLMVRLANVVFERSQLDVTIHLVSIHQLGTRSTDNFSADLSRASDNDGVWDELLNLREQKRADIVSVLVGGTQNEKACGLGYMSGFDAMGKSVAVKDQSQFMFSIVSVNEICGPLVLAHEMGHNLGSDHDLDHAIFPTLSNFIGHGYRFVGRSRQTWRTVMSYSPGLEIPYYAIPELKFDGKALGRKASADLGTLFRENVPIVAGFYESLGTSLQPKRELQDPSKVVSTFSGPSRSSKRTLITTVTADGSPVAGADLLLQFRGRGKSGFSGFRGGRTDKHGSLKLKNVSGRFNAHGDYKMCLLRPTGDNVCSDTLHVD